MTSTGTTTQAVKLTTAPPASLAEALAVLQADLPDVGKDKTAKVQSRDGKSSYTYDYANLASILRAVRPKMGPLGLAFTAKPTTVFRDNGQPEFVLEYKLLHGPSGETDAGEWPLPDPTRTTPQQVGSAITYARRYAFCAVIGIAPDDDDDDGQSAGVASKTAASKRASPPQRAADNLPRNADGSTSRSRTTDAELAATGQETDQQRRDHNRLERDVKGTGPQGTQRLSAVPDDDPWYLPEPLPVPTAAPPKAGVIQMHMKRILRSDDQGAETPEQKNERLAFLSAIVGHKVRSTNELTAVEGIEATKFLGGIKNKDALKRELMMLESDRDE